MGFLIFPLLVITLSEIAHGISELSALMELKTSLDPDGSLLFSWTRDGNPCEFEGVACDEFGAVANISLQGKGLAGSLSPAISGLKNLTGVFLHYNALTGDIPREIAGLERLTDLYLNVNNLSGNIPPEIGEMSSLQVLQLCYNNLNGSIPPKVGLLKNLTVLALQSNNLTGAIPASLGDLPQLIRLDLSSNNLFGSIPVKLSQLPVLEVLDLSNNSFSGSVPSELKGLDKGFLYSNNKDLCGVGFSSLRSCNSSDVVNPRPEPFKPNSNPMGLSSREKPESAEVTSHCNHLRCSSYTKSSAGVIIAGTVVVVIGSLVILLLVFVWYRRRKQKIGSLLDASDSRLSTDQAKDSYRSSTSTLINRQYSSGWDPLADSRSGYGFSEEISQSFRFNLEEVECATQYFSEINLLGKSSFASSYKGILRDGTVVAVKSIYKTSCRMEEAELLKGLKLLTVLRHENLVGLKGFCCSRGRGECFLVYDFVHNGSLLSYLDVESDASERILDWATRVSIVKGIAKGIEYLHSTRANKPSLVHRSVSAQKVLIDQNFSPRIAGSGVYKLLADDILFSSIKGSAAMGYLAPEYATTGRFTEKSDVYAFGVLVFQVLAGKSKTNQLRLSAESGELEDLIDEKLKGNFSKTEAAKLAAIALVCTSEAPSQRPSMDKVVQELCSKS